MESNAIVGLVSGTVSALVAFVSATWTVSSKFNKLENLIVSSKLETNEKISSSDEKLRLELERKIGESEERLKELIKSAQ